MEEERVKVDAIVVGGGPAGLIAAYRMAQEGLEVIVVERGEYPGSKNVSGLLYAHVLQRVMPDFLQQGAPVERPVTRRAVGFLGEKGHMLMEFSSSRWSTPPHNHTFVVYRARFDRWLAQRVEAEGATVLDGMVVDDLVYEGEGPGRRAVGVRIRGEEEPFLADAVILADGAHAMVTEKAREALGMRGGRIEQTYGLGVKEVIGLPSKVIEERFHLEPGMGAAVEFVGSPFKGLVGGGFIYTGKESLAVGFIAKLESLRRLKVSPNDLIQGFISHPQIRPYLEGGELLEYSAHVIPEGGYYAIPQLTANGVIIVGDAAGLVNPSIYHEGANLAMESGRLAAETVIMARRVGDYSRRTLSIYEDMLRENFILKDLKKFKDIPYVHELLPELLSLLPERVCGLLVDFYRQEGKAKSTVQREALKGFIRGLPAGRLLRLLIKLRKMAI